MNSKKHKTKEIHTKHIILKLLKTKFKEKKSKDVREKIDTIPIKEKKKKNKSRFLMSNLRGRTFFKN